MVDLLRSSAREKYWHIKLKSSLQKAKNFFLTLWHRRIGKSSEWSLIKGYKDKDIRYLCSLLICYNHIFIFAVNGRP